MKIRPTTTFITALAATALATAVQSSGGERMPSAPPPNIIIIFTDDQGYGDVGVFRA